MSHPGRIDVSEEETSAAAAMIELRNGDAGVVTDRPFFLAIRDHRSGPLPVIGRKEAPPGGRDR